MNGLLLVIQTISDFLWGTPMTIALIGTGLYLSIKFKFRYITKIKFHFQNTFGKMFKGKGEGECFIYCWAVPALEKPIRCWPGWRSWLGQRNPASWSCWCRSSSPLKARGRCWSAWALVWPGL